MKKYLIDFYKRNLRRNLEIVTIKLKFASTIPMSATHDPGLAQMFENL